MCCNAYWWCVSPMIGRRGRSLATAEAVRPEKVGTSSAFAESASAVARLRPRRPIIGLTHHQYALQHMALEWGVTPLHVPEAADVDELWQSAIDAARRSGIVNSGDRVVITAGTAVNIPGSTNVIKVEIA